MFDSVESFIIRQLLKNTAYYQLDTPFNSQLTWSTLCGYVDTWIYWLLILWDEDIVRALREKGYYYIFK